MLEGIAPILSYRDDEAGLRVRRDELLLLCNSEVDGARDALVGICARRVARVAGGATAIAGAACITFLSGLTYGVKALLGITLFAREPPVTSILVAAVLLVPLAMALGWTAARLRMRMAIERALQPTSDVRLDVARLEHAPPLALLSARVDSLELHSVWVPLVGWALVAPLSMHLTLALLVGWVGIGRLQEFDWWILTSLVLTGEQFPDGECDFVEQVASPLPLQIICEMMGIPAEHEAQIFQWTNVILGVGDPEYVGSFEQLMGVLMQMIADAASPIAIIGGAGWHAKARAHFTNFADRIGLPVAGAFRRQDAISNASKVWAGNLGYGPGPKLVERIKAADLVIAIGARLGEATTDSYTLITPDHPGQLLVHVHPDPDELGRVYRPDLAICADMAEFAEAADLWDDDVVPFDAGEEAHNEWLDWTTAQPAPYPLDMAACVTRMRETWPDDAIICNGAGNFSGWWHRFWHYNGFPTQLAPTAGAMGYGVPAAVAAALRHPERQVVALAGDGDFLMNGQELATAVQYGCNLTVVLIDNGTYGTIRMHQEREFPGRVSGTTLHNPDFAALAVAYGGWAQRVETTDQFISALAEAKDRTGLRLIHALIDPEQLSAGGATISGLRAKAKG